VTSQTHREGLNRNPDNHGRSTTTLLTIAMILAALWKGQDGRIGAIMIVALPHDVVDVDVDVAAVEPRCEC
jgi:hypothetical protein